MLSKQYLVIQHYPERKVIVNNYDPDYFDEYIGLYIHSFDPIVSCTMYNESRVLWRTIYHENIQWITCIYPSYTLQLLASWGIYNEATILAISHNRSLRCSDYCCGPCNPHHCISGWFVAPYRDNLTCGTTKPYKTYTIHQQQDRVNRATTK